MSSSSRTGRVAKYPAKRYQDLIPVRRWLLAGLGLLVIAGASALARRSHPTIGPMDGEDPPRIIRIHRSDLRGTDPSGAMRIRCRFCVGGGKTWHWQNIVRNEHIIRSFKDGITVCPACDGSGVVSTQVLQDAVRIVPDDQPTDYNEKRLVR